MVQTTLWRSPERDNQLAYPSDSRDWFDLSLISKDGREEADRRKLSNRRSYQELIFDNFGLGFCGEAVLEKFFIGAAILGARRLRSPLRK